MTPETTAGFDAIDFAQDVLGITLLPWQRWLLIHMLELNEDNTFRFRTCVILIARQSGKTTLVGILSLWRMYVDGAALTIGTAQNLDVAEEAWSAAVDMAESVPELAALVAQVNRTNGKKALVLAGGQRYKVQAANRRGGRGLSADLVILDELREHRDFQAWGAVTKTTNARPRPQIVAMSNAGDDESVVLNHLRELALSELDGETRGDGSLGIFEWSAPDDVDCTCNGAPHAPRCRLNDPDAWALANPSLGYIVAPAAITAALSTDPVGVFRTEVLCQRVRSVADYVIPLKAWGDCADRSTPPTPIVGRIVVGVDIAMDRSSAAIYVAGFREDGLPQVEYAEYRAGTEWVAQRVAGIVKGRKCRVVLDPFGPAGILPGELERLNVEPYQLSAREHAEACALLYDAVQRGGVRHLDDDNLNDALRAAAKRPLGDSWAWGRKPSAGDISPLVAATFAYWGLARLPVPSSNYYRTFG